MHRRHLFLILEIGAAVLLFGAIAAAEPRQRTLAFNTLLLIGGVLAISLPIGTLLAVLIARTNLPLRKTFGLLLAMQLFLPLYLQASAWQAGFGLQGWYTQIFGGSNNPWLDGWRGAIWVHALAAIPWTALIVGLGLRSVEPELEEDALLDASGPRVILHVSLRRASGAVISAALWTAIILAGEMTVTDIYAVRTYAEELYTATQVEPDPITAQQTLLPGIAIQAGLWLVALRCWSRMLPADVAPANRRAHVFALGRWRWPAALLVSLLVLLIVVVPSLNLLVMAGKYVVSGPAGIERHFSMQQALARIAEAPWQQSAAIGFSLEMGTIVATASTILAALFAWPARRGGWVAMVPLGIAIFSLVIPGTMLGLILLRVFNAPHQRLLNALCDDQLFLPCLVQTIRALPLALLILWFAARTVPKNLLELAELDGAGPLKRALFVALPLRWPAVVAAWLVSLVVAMGELPGTLVVQNAGVMTLATEINHWVHYGIDDKPAGACLFVELCFFGLAGLISMLARRALNARR